MLRRKYVRQQRLLREWRLLGARRELRSRQRNLHERRMHRMRRFG
jgi:hypothetical protein